MDTRHDAGWTELAEADRIVSDLKEHIRRSTQGQFHMNSFAVTSLRLAAAWAVPPACRTAIGTTAPATSVAAAGSPRLLPDRRRLRMRGPASGEERSMDDSRMS
ncbi:hypothetical protein ACIP10_29300 [Streptomyces galbus]|uniref:hypothetical protein n=1 Tax=Streptomyces galbus TaxID=33898 RepID=UPI0037A4E745